MATTQYVRFPAENGGGGSGTVTSVGLSLPASVFIVSGSPVTTTGTLTGSFATQSANTVFAGPPSGGAAVPTFRALVSADIPSLNYVTDVTASAPLASSGGQTPNITIISGNLTDVGTDGIVITGGTGAVIGSGTSIAQHVADSTHNGYLSSTDWSTFNNKQPAGNYITALTGDATATGPGSVALTLATVNGNVGSFGSSTAIPSFTVNGKGLITAASTNAVIAPAGTLTGTTLAANVVSSSLTSVGTITTGVWNGTAIDAAHGGTGQTSLTLNNVILGNGTSPVQFVAPGSSGNVLTSDGTTWSSQPPSVGSPVVARYYMAAGQSLTTGDNFLDYDTVSYDPNSIVTTGPAWHMTAPSTGYYQFYFTLHIDGLQADDSAGLKFIINGATTFSDTQWKIYSSPGGTDTNVSAEDMIFLNATDTVSLFIEIPRNATVDSNPLFNFVTIKLVH